MRQEVWRRAGEGGTLLVLALLAWNTLNSVSESRPGTDSCIFAAIGLHLLEGYDLYTEVWDHKPPGVFCLNALALHLGGRDFESIHTLQRCFAVGGVILFYFILRIAFRKRVVAALFSLVYLHCFYDAGLYGGGNFSEEYGSVFTLGGILFALLECRQGPRRFKRGGIAFPYLAGTLFGFAALTKEPFLVTAVPWAIYLVAVGVSEWGGRFRRFLALVLGGLIPFLVFMVYLVSVGAFWARIDTLDYATRVSEHFADESRWVSFAESALTARILFGATSAFACFAFIAGLYSIARTGFNEKYRYAPITFFFSFCLHFGFTAITGKGSHHYFLRVVPMFVLLGASGFVFLAEAFASSRYPLARRGWLPVCLAVFLTIDSPILDPWWSRFAKPSKEYSPGPAARLILDDTEEGDTIWTPNGQAAWCYLETGRLSPTRNLASFPHHFIDTAASTGEEKEEEVYEDLKARPPKYIVLPYRPHYAPYESKFWNWAQIRYEQLSQKFPGTATTLLRLKEEGE